MFADHDLNSQGDSLDLVANLATAALDRVHRETRRGRLSTSILQGDIGDDTTLPERRKCNCDPISCTDLHGRRHLCTGHGGIGGFGWTAASQARETA